MIKLASGKKIFLYATGFFSGMSVMAIELGASRLLAPYFSSSQIVWTVIIGTIMIAMAIGNVWGGAAADKNPDPFRLYRRLFIAAIWTALIPFIGKYIITGISLGLAMVIKSNYLIWASFASCIVLFVFPLMILGTVTPSLMKYATESLDDNGKTVGTLEALGTIGSIIGTFLPTFVTIPAVGTSVTFLIFAAVLSLLCLIYFIFAKKMRIVGAVAAAAVTVMIFVPVQGSYAFWEDNIIYEDESIYNYLQVKETSDTIALSTNVMIGVQSVYVKDGTLSGMYYDYALAAPLMAENSARELLVLGMGTGTYASQCRNYFPNLNITGVEIDEKITALSHKYFNLPNDVETIVGDGRMYLSVESAAGRKWDVIMVDAYQDITIPFQMSSEEFFTQVKNSLTDGGVMVVNMNMRADGADGNSINDWLCGTIKSVFSEVYVFNVPGGTNTVLFASDNPGMCGQFSEKTAQLTMGTPLCRLMTLVDSRMTEVSESGLVLTDDKAPVELLGMRALDSLIRSELKSVRETLKKDGIGAFLN